MVRDKEAAGKSRRERRKEARKAKNLNKRQSWLQHQKSQKLRNAEISKRISKNLKPKSKNHSNDDFNEREGKQEVADVPMKLELKSEPLEHELSVDSKMVKEKKGLKRNSKTRFEELVGMDMRVADSLAQEDLIIEKRLAKKLKVKDGKLRGVDDEINMIIGAIPSMIGSFEEDENPDAEDLSTGMVENDTSNKKHKRKKSSVEFAEDVVKGDLSHVVSKPDETSDADIGLEEVATNRNASKKHRKSKRSKQKQESIVADETENGALEPLPTHNVDIELKDTPTKVPTIAGSLKYVAPHLRSHAGNESEENMQIRRRVRGLLNKLSESNVESVTGEMATIFRSVSPSISSQIISQEVLTACYSGPCGSEQYAAVFAAFVAGLACSVGVNFSAKLMTLLAKSFEDQYLKEDDLSLRNLSLLLSYLCIFGVFSSDLIYDFLIMSSKQLTETDVPIILTVLQCCGIKIRADDPAAMKNFIQSVQNRVNELKASSREGQTNIDRKRIEFMLETITDVKNNKKKPREETVQHTRIKKWLQKTWEQVVGGKRKLMGSA
uniref:Nucleolar MIF4G domain-containing protein 1 isoform X2 n=2 Tax=Rhizophora mucronata TaxID=61149 RepID=A0A2P2KZS7_RHIMU